MTITILFSIQNPQKKNTNMLETMKVSTINTLVHNLSYWKSMTTKYFINKIYKRVFKHLSNLYLHSPIIQTLFSNFKMKISVSFQNVETVVNIGIKKLHSNIKHGKVYQERSFWNMVINKHQTFGISSAGYGLDYAWENCSFWKKTDWINISFMKLLGTFT